jgi:serine/threonine protein kinase
MLGKGSYGKVYKVQREMDGQFYALKECDLGTMSHPERMDAVNEVRLLVSMNHPSVVSGAWGMRGVEGRRRLQTQQRVNP